MRVEAVKSNYNFSSANKPQQRKTDKNPISKTGEKTNLAVATFVGGLGLGARLLFELFDDGFVFEDLGKAAKNYVNKNHKGLSGAKKEWFIIGTALSFIGAAIGGVALLYTIYKAPKINYEGNINAFKKSKDMDVYIKGNNVEKEILTQMNDRAQNADDKEKEKLKEQYMKMQMAKNQLPDFIKNDKKFKMPQS
ncbi:TPA: hypothetical protein IAC10_09585 [Candidatus Scatousia excrementigallinarum]|uniref:Transmembrane protein n=1 Tax=Candidatus Scatousia excrementigallinarum TaxID=2840935 RepID=A0A9D1JNS9_9BACT|nr:hypothetical protein [Candidatus Scatousia excrementigallinarum]